MNIAPVFSTIILFLISIDAQGVALVSKWNCETTIDAKASLLGGVKKFRKTFGSQYRNPPDFSGFPVSFESSSVATRALNRFHICWESGKDGPFADVSLACSSDTLRQDNNYKYPYGGVLWVKLDQDSNVFYKHGEMETPLNRENGFFIARLYNQLCKTKLNSQSTTGRIQESNEQLTGSFKTRTQFSTCEKIINNRLKVKRNAFTEFKTSFVCHPLLGQ